MNIHTGIHALITVLGMVFMTPAVIAEELPDGREYPQTIPGVTGLNAEGLIESITQYPDMLIIDSRASMDRKQGFIEGSISLPDTDTDCDTLSVIVPDKAQRVLFYCNGPKCGRSVKAIDKAKECGYSHLFWFRGGFEEWTAKGYPVLKE